MLHDCILIAIALAAGIYIDRKGLPYIGRKIEEGFDKLKGEIASHKSATVAATKENTAIIVTAAKK